jgi:hypothetical protein
MGVRKPPAKPSESTEVWFKNLYDLFLNAALMHSEMNASPMKPLPPNLKTGSKEMADAATAFGSSRRARFERFWMLSMYVLVETWLASEWKPLIDYVRTLADATEVDALIASAETSGHMKAMRDCRDYMVHRDRRSYFDVGHFAVTKREDNERLHAAFSRLLREAIDAHKTARDAASSE